VSARASAFPLGTAITLEQLELDPHPDLARLRANEPVSWVPVLGGWIVTSYELASGAMRDSEAFTVADQRFSTAQVIGHSMLSTDGVEHARHREPFIAPFRPQAVKAGFAEDVERDAGRLVDALEPAHAAELRAEFAGPLATGIIARALGLAHTEVADLRSWYEAIVAAVTSLTAGAELPPDGTRAFGALRERLAAELADTRAQSVLKAAAAASDLTQGQLISNAAVLLFGGIETTEGMICNALVHLLERPAVLAQVLAQPALLDAGIEESLRLEPAAAIVDRYATTEVHLGGADIARGDLVRVSIAAANRDPRVFPDPDRFRLMRPHVRRHLSFALGPHVCLGVHLARLEAQTGIATLLRRLPDIRLDPEKPPPSVRGLVFRKPQALAVVWS